MSFYTQISTQVKQLIHCESAELETFCSKLLPQPKKLKRKDFLLLEGQTCSNLYFINQGCLRYFYVVNGEEMTGQFFFENSWYTDMESFLLETPSLQNIQALEPTELVVLPKTSLYQLYEENLIFERMGRLLIEQAFLGISRKNQILTNLSPEERYLHLINTRPKVVKRVSLQYIASYLGIKPESLSRIRRRLFENRAKS